MFRAVFRNATLVLGLGFLVACTNADDLDKPPVALGNFALGHNVVVAPNMVKGPVSREADKDKFIAAMKAAVDERFGRYEGDKHYHFGISLEGYVLAQPGIPLVASPKSILIANLTVWDDAAGKKLTDEPHQITVIESFGGHTLLGSGYTQTEEEQMQGLARNMAKQIQNYLRRQDRSEGWFKTKKEDEAAAKSEEDTTVAQEAAKKVEEEVAAKVEAPKDETEE